MSALDLNHYGRVTAAGIYANVLLTIFVAGLQFFMCIYGLTVFVDTPSSSRKGRRPYMIVSFIILITWCITAALDAYSVFRSLSESTSGEEFYRLTVSFEGEWFRVLSLFSLFLGLFVGDGLLLYRAYVVWKDRRWALIFPCLCYLTSLGLALYIASPQKENWRDNDRIIAGSFTFVAVSVNVMVTLLISFRLLRARQLMAKVLPCHDFLLYKKVAIILIESALPVAFFGLCYAITLVLVGPMGKSTESASIWQVLNMTFSALYFSFAVRLLLSLAVCSKLADDKFSHFRLR
ncbi:hypothetical protein CC2G_002744 [Coprinopsis cinerea AmutBmut pab1-1]|nr:hypothetical protein CC2G_002744 [Coprinopsis cinerea AmutBmut pab1-1]